MIINNGAEENVLSGTYPEALFLNLSDFCPYLASCSSLKTSQHAYVSLGSVYVDKTSPESYQLITDHLVGGNLSQSTAVVPSMLSHTGPLVSLPQLTPPSSHPIPYLHLTPQFFDANSHAIRCSMSIYTYSLTIYIYI